MSEVSSDLFTVMGGWVVSDLVIDSIFILSIKLCCFSGFNSAFDDVRWNISLCCLMEPYHVNCWNFLNFCLEITFKSVMLYLTISTG